MNKIDLIIDALEKAKDGWQCFDEYEKALAAAREFKALKPVGVFAYDEENKVWEELLPNIEGIPLYALPAELSKPDVTFIDEGNKQEPVALKMVYGEVCYQSKHDDQSFGMWCQITEREFPNGTPFYTTPPRKPWVGLTDDEMDSLVTQARKVPVEIPCDSFTTRLLKLAEQLLKERNT